MKLALLRCRFLGHAYSNTTEIRKPSLDEPRYIIHLSCIRCHKRKVLTSGTGTLPKP